MTVVPPNGRSKPGADVVGGLVFSAPWSPFSSGHLLDSQIRLNRRRISLISLVLFYASSLTIGRLVRREEDPFDWLVYYHERRH
jgi:hypothetical protein